VVTGNGHFLLNTWKLGLITRELPEGIFFILSGKNLLKPIDSSEIQWPEGFKTEWALNSLTEDRRLRKNF